jgi:hypothetical protein
MFAEISSLMGSMRAATCLDSKDTLGRKSAILYEKILDPPE